jgi:hypothetical protein
MVMNPKLLLNLLLIPISFKIPPYSPLSKGGWGRSNPFSQGGRRGLNLNTEEGFTIIDVIIGMLVAFLFLMASLQAMVVEAYFRIAGQASSEGLLLIQQDLEEVRFLATESSLPYVAATCTSGYGAALQTNILNNMTAKDSNKDGIYTAKPNNTIEYQLTRTATPSTTDKQVLTLSYSVKRDPKGGTNYTKEVATLYTEVIPDAAFQCN